MFGPPKECREVTIVPTNDIIPTVPTVTHPPIWTIYIKDIEGLEGKHITMPVKDEDICAATTSPTINQFGSLTKHLDPENTPPQVSLKTDAVADSSTPEIAVLEKR